MLVALALILFWSLQDMQPLQLWALWTAEHDTELSHWHTFVVLVTMIYYPEVHHFERVIVSAIRTRF